jgi:hypothetical protein
MKKFLITISFVSSLTFSYAQAIKTNAGTFIKPKEGDIITELNFSPNLTGDIGIFSLPTFSKDLSLIGIKARKFISENKAYRAVGNLSISNSGQKGSTTYFALGAGLGIENHLKGAERLSTYWGYEGKIGYVSGDTSSASIGFGGGTKSTLTKFGIQANTFTGFDYYIIPNVYLGAEISYGLAITNTKPQSGDGTTKFELAPGIISTFRLGWKF